jgi:hypothetical protein
VAIVRQVLDLTGDIIWLKPKKMPIGVSGNGQIAHSVEV